MREISAEKLKVGDVVEVWWNPGRDTIIGIDPYRGPFKDCIGLLRFAQFKVGMSMWKGEIFTKVN